MKTVTNPFIGMALDRLNTLWIALTFQRSNILYGELVVPDDELPRLCQLIEEVTEAIDAAEDNESAAVFEYGLDGASDEGVHTMRIADVEDFVMDELQSLLLTRDAIRSALWDKYGSDFTNEESWDNYTVPVQWVRDLFADYGLPIAAFELLEAKCPITFTQSFEARMEKAGRQHIKNIARCYELDAEKLERLKSLMGVGPEVFENYISELTEYRGNEGAKSFINVVVAELAETEEFLWACVMGGFPGFRARMGARYWFEVVDGRIKQFSK